MVAPLRWRLRMYQVGFGDCFLLSFEYAAPLDDGRDVRHILIDFGSTRLPSRWKSLEAIADQIKTHTGGEIDVVVVSHRHKDHLSAFGESDLMSNFMAAGFPKLVVRSWTERPSAAGDATGVAPLGSRSRAFLAQLGEARTFAATLSRRLKGASARSLAGETLSLAFDQLSNEDAVNQLASWGTGAKGRYLNYGADSGIEDLIPGLTVKVLGPPTVEQHKAVANQRSSDPKEFWMIYQGIARGLRIDEPLAERETKTVDNVPDPADSYSQWSSAGQGAAMSPANEAPAPERPVGEVGPIRWLTDRMSSQSMNALLRIVRILDTALNNTSLILLFEVRGTGEPVRLLFPGDAQIENWEYALKVVPEHEANQSLLRDVDLYKVGHHGSRNATPRTLFNLWDSDANRERPLVAVMSTKPGVHGKSAATRVPRKTLVAALDTRTKEKFYSTEGITQAQPFVELVADLSGKRNIKLVTKGSHPKPRSGASVVDMGDADEAELDDA